MNCLKMRQHLLSVPDLYLVLQLIGKKKLMRALAAFLDSLICHHFISVEGICSAACIFHLSFFTMFHFF